MDGQVWQVSVENPSSFTSDVEEPGDWPWNDDLPDFVPRVAVEHTEPEVHWNESEWSERGANEVPSVV